jgi:hypothetical protein
LRRSLASNKTNPHRNGKDNVTDTEVIAFGEYEQALVDKNRADAELRSADAALARAKKSGDAETAKDAAERQRKAVC